MRGKDGGRTMEDRYDVDNAEEHQGIDDLCLSKYLRTCDHNMFALYARSICV